MWFPHRHQAGAGVLSLQWPFRAVVLPYPSPVPPSAPTEGATMTKGASVMARALVFQRPVFSSVQMRVYWRSTSGGSTANVKSFASTSAGG